MRKALPSVVLGLSLLSPACRSASKDAGTERPEATARVATSTPVADMPAAPPPPPAASPPPADPAARLTAAPQSATHEAKPDVQATDATAPRLMGGKRFASPRNTATPGVAGGAIATSRGHGSGMGTFTSGDAVGGEAYRDWGQNAWPDAAQDHLSTFAADVDTASYTIARRKLTEGKLPPTAAVRVEEFVNYFRYRFPDAQPGSPFAIALDAVPSPLSPGRTIVRVGVATRPLAQRDRKPAHLVFLVDVSGSMSSPDKLELAKRSLRILTNNLKDGDTVALVTYAGSSRVVLPATGIANKAVILAAIDELSSGGSTAMGSGIDLAYQQAMAGFTPGSNARVIVCSDGDANVGSHTHAEILRLIAGRAKQGVTLSTIGFGMGNYKDELMEQLADKGNGNNFYIDSLSAAKKVFQEQLGSTLEVVAKDVKFQVDFDPAQVRRYRLIGYENRDIRDSDFRNDKVDAGEIGAGHQVTALYEVELTAQTTTAPLATVRIRHKKPQGDTASELAFPMPARPAASFANAEADLRFAFAVAAFADVLRGNKDAERWSLAQIRDLARGAAGDDLDRKELVGLIERAMSLKGPAIAR